MRSSLSAICILLSFIQTTVVSAVDSEPGYDCGNTFIPGRRLNEIIGEVKGASRLQLFSPEKSRKRLSNIYFGPPFYKIHLLWPVSPKTKDYDEAAKTPFNVVIDQKTFEIISVISKHGKSVIECKMREKSTIESSTNNFDCEPGFIYNQDLRLAASTACPKLRESRDLQSEFYPLRYRGLPYKDSGKQLYIFPVSAHGAPDTREGLPNEFVVINSDCKIVGAVKGVNRGMSNAHYVQCKEKNMFNSQVIPSGRYVTQASRINAGSLSSSTYAKKKSPFTDVRAAAVANRPVGNSLHNFEGTRAYRGQQIRAGTTSFIPAII